MQVKLKNHPGIITLSDKNFLGSGGEGSIYVRSNVVYKVCEAGKSIPSKKISELQAIKHKLIIVPEEIIEDKSGHEIGYTMRYVPNTHVLCQLFTKSFRERNKLEPQQIFKLVRQKQDTLSFIHSKNILCVDYNEFNFLVDSTFTSVYNIDTNSYQTQSFPAQALMESVRDRHNPKFSELTDWFSFGIVTFQMMIGIHPYRGKHSQYKSLDDRMLHNVSVLNRKVSYPQGACYDLATIPALYLSWYKAIFEEGKRVKPPDSLIDNIPLATIKRVISSDNLFNITKVNRVSGHYTTINFVDYPVKLVDHGVTIGTNGPFPAEQFTIYQNRLYVKYGETISEICHDPGLKSSFYPRTVCNCLEYATKLYDGIAIQNIFGTYWISIFPASGQCKQYKLDLSTSYKIIDAKFDNGILMLATNYKGDYYRITYNLFDNDIMSCLPMLEKEQVGDTVLNFTVLDNGVCIRIPEDGLMEISKRTEKKIVQNPQISLGWDLYHKGNVVCFTENSESFQLSMK